MNLAKKLFQNFVLKKIKDTNWDEGTDSPLIVELDTTDVCDLACPGCISEDIINNKNSFSNERLLELGREFHEAGVKGVVLIGGGEPLAHPAVGQLIKYLGENDIHVGITTNGTLMHRYMDEIAEYSSWTRVSMDAGTDETFTKLRPTKNGKSKFDKVLSNMRELAKRKKGKLGYSFLLRTKADLFGIESNIHEIYSAAELAKEIGCDYFEVKPSYSYTNDADHFLVQHDKESMQEAKEIIDRLKDLETDNFKILKSVNLPYSLEGKQHIQPKAYTSCPATQLRTLITPTGGFLCPYFRGKKHRKIGDLKEQTLTEMWNGKERAKTMEKLNPQVDCTMHCIRHLSNTEVFNIIDKNKKGEPIDFVEEFDRFI